MKSNSRVFAIALAAGAASLGLTAQVLAQAPPGAAAAPSAAASKPTPKLADGHPDLNGVWTGRGDPAIAGIGGGAARPNGDVCVIGCPRAGGPGAGGAGAGGGRAGGGAPGGAPGAGAFGGAPGGAGPAAGGAPAGGGAARAGGRGAPNFPSYKPEFAAKVKDLSDRQVELDASLRCQLPGVPRIGAPSKIVQTAKEVVFLYDDLNGSFFRVIPTDGRPHRKDLSPSFLGDAIGHWEGDTLVVETTNFNDETWLIDNGAFHTLDLKVVERLRRVGDTIEFRATAYDPAVLTQPWEGRPRTLQLGSSELEETSRCEDRTIPHIVDGSHHDNAR